MHSFKFKVLNKELKFEIFNSEHQNSIIKLAGILYLESCFSKKGFKITINKFKIYRK